MNELVISRDQSKLDILLIYNFLKNAYWSKGRTKKQVIHSIEHSICFGVYLNEKQIGFARIVTDKTIFAYVMDVFIVSSQRGKGYSKQLLEYMLKEPDLLHIEKWILATKDAHQLYHKFGFNSIQHPEKLLERIN
ncbi:MAG: GNAT family N-acetyltransferase [Saprospiraceae bacterium]|nr:GNAT family N-acetyltransferase [Saprospiraceae bacterium]